MTIPQHVKGTLIKLQVNKRDFRDQIKRLVLGLITSLRSLHDTTTSTREVGEAALIILRQSSAEQTLHMSDKCHGETYIRYEHDGKHERTREQMYGGNGA